MPDSVRRFAKAAQRTASARTEVCNRERKIVALVYFDDKRIEAVSAAPICPHNLETVRPAKAGIRRVENSQ